MKIAWVLVKEIQGFREKIYHLTLSNQTNEKLLSHVGGWSLSQ